MFFILHFFWVGDLFFFFLRDGVAFMVKSLSVSNEMIHNLDDFILIFVG